MIKNSSLQDYIFIVVVALMAIGAVFVFSAGADISQQISPQNFYRFPALRQLLFFPLAVMVMLAFSFFDYHKLSFDKGIEKSPSTYLLGISIILITLVLIPALGTEVNYARRWLRIPFGAFSLNFQPSELAKWSMIFFLAAFCDFYNESLHFYRERFIPICLLIGLVAGLILIEDFGTAALITLISFIILFIAGAKITHMLSLAPVGILAFCVALFSSKARMDRIAAFFHPEEHADTASYQANQSLIAMGSGNVWGKGLGKGICKYGHLPEDTTDFIFSIIGEEMGLVGTITVIVLFIAFLVLGFMVIARCKDRLGRYLACGIVLVISIQAALNIGVVTVVLPTKGIPLPFVSSGGTSLLVSAAAIGLLLNIAKQLPEPASKEKRHG